MRWICKGLIFLLIVQPVLLGQSSLKDFKATNQQVALVGVFNEFVEPPIEKQLLEEIRKKISRYSLTFSQRNIDNFQLLNNPNNQYFKTVSGELPEAQKNFLDQLGKDNSAEIIVLGNLRESYEGVEIDLQLYDTRINSLSGIVSNEFRLQEREQPLGELVYNLMNHLDREGFVWKNPQDFLQKPSGIGSAANNQDDFLPPSADSSFVSPEGLGATPLAGEVSIGGNKTPFWEKWWFWTVLGGGLATIGGLSYFIFILESDPVTADVTFKIRDPDGAD